MRKLTTVLVPVTAMCLALPAIGLAGLPEPNDATINVPSKLGGVELGMKIKKADKAWGKTGDCDVQHGVGSCFYAEKKSPEDGTASIATDGKGKVFSASIDAGFNSKGKYVFGGPLNAFQTAEGIGIGDKISKVGKAYPKADRSGSSYTVNGKGKAYMSFIAGDDKHITSIGLVGGPQG